MISPKYCAIYAFILSLLILQHAQAAEVQLLGAGLSSSRPFAAAPLLRIGSSLPAGATFSGILRTSVSTTSCINSTSVVVVLVAPSKGVPLATRLNAAIASGASAALVFGPTGGQIVGSAERSLVRGEISRDFPVFEISRDEATFLWEFLRSRERESNSSCETFAIVNLTMSETNEWSQVLSHGVVVALFDVLLPLTSATELAFAAYKLFCFFRSQGIYASVPTVFLTLHCFASLLRVIFLAVDPFGKRGVWPFGAWTILLSITWPINLINTLLVALFYRELNAGPIRMGLFLDELQIPYVVISIFIFAVELLASGFSAAFYNAEPLKIVVRLTYSLMTIGISAMLINSGMAVLKRANKDALRTRGTKLMMASSVAMIVYSIIMLLVVYGETFHPIFYVASYTALFLSLHAIGVIQVAAFDPRNSTKSSVSKSTTSQKSNTDRYNQNSSNRELSGF